jgi:CheY-like chemotaxis protein
VKVLIADDDRTIRALLGDMLAGMGHEVVAAENGAEAVELCLRENPEVVILDFLMPKLSGLDALKRLRELGSRVPVVLLTAISDASIRELGDVERPDAILEKPFRRKAIERAIEKATRREGGCSARCSCGCSSRPRCRSPSPRR